MKGHIAFCPHFHQPHFQLYKTREEAYRNSYLPWLNLLKNSAKMEGFFVNLHFSGPFLYWIKDKKPEYIGELKALYKSGKVGIIGGFADEPFIQLSSRRDDFFYQLKKYEELTFELFGVGADEWQGIHIVEREAGEFLLGELSYAAKKIGAFPLYYLDAETFYNTYFAYPGSKNDFCLKNFGFKDSYSKTTISHLPDEMLFFALRDEIGGQEYFAVPVHSPYRYHLLKRNSFSPEDKVITKPKHYYFYVKDALENAWKLIKRYGKNIEPVLLIFEDAEKLGQWSKDPAGDARWMEEFFNLVMQDEEIDFIGLKDYVLKYGFLDTYPVRSSHSYAEWENWTAKRGIRGVVFGDERLRKVINCLRDFESEQAEFEDYVIDLFWQNEHFLSDGMPKMLKTAVLNSAERYEIVKSILEKYFSADMAYNYELINRVRHVVYQEDPKWASRHPSYGSSPYYDMQGLSYLYIAQRLLRHMINEVKNKKNENIVEIKDWDQDGTEEVIVKTGEQMVVIDTEGGCISYQQVIDGKAASSKGFLEDVLAQNIPQIPAYSDIYKVSYPLVFTETDSDLTLMFYKEGGRKEICRNSMRCNILFVRDGEYKLLGDFATAHYEITEVIKEEKEVRIILERTEQVLIGDKECVITLVKEFTVLENRIGCSFSAVCDALKPGFELFLVPQLVTSAAPSDEVDFEPLAWLKITSEAEGEMLYEIEEKQVHEGENNNLTNENFVSSLPQIINYFYQIKSAGGQTFVNQVGYNIKTMENIKKIKIKPAVGSYYKEYIYDEQSKLGYHTSGLAINPYVAFQEGRADFKVENSWRFAVIPETDDKEGVVELLIYKK
ncbi:hypothetical protein [Thermosyntropha sp.]|uniref:hypothetical protein n=1 Tax=Thermosyntropha sp. TaxID=2740820 RepID=UPI0025E675F3|nr:hypothetical protein [Thermosyntropha sp.]MBO8158346.1 hypothetical protein [Thermosyntropha sp.]